MSVYNPVLFIGETVANGTLGAPLSTDSGGLLVSGISTTEVSATADATTTSAADVLMTGMTSTPVAGTYMVVFSGGVDHSNQNVAVVVSIYVGGALKTDSVRSPIPRFNGVSANSLTPIVTTNGIVTVNGSQAIEIRWKTASGTATVHQRTLDIIRVA